MKKMSGMTGYDQATSYPTSQYNYVPNLQGPDGSLVGGVDPRQLHAGWGMPNQAGHAHYTPMQGSPGQHHAAGHRGYPYYDRNGYYVHQQHASGGGGVGSNGGFESWHDPAGGLRPDSPTAAGLSAPPSYPSPAVSTAGAGSNYSCKMAVQSPAHPGAGVTPPSPTQKTNDNPQLQSPYGSGAGTQYGQCPLSTNSQPTPGGAPSYSNSQIPQPPGGATHPPNVHNSYSLSGSEGTSGGGSGAHVGQPSPVQQQPPGGSQNQQGAPQAPLPSPLYPWMRSQFGKALFSFGFNSVAVGDFFFAVMIHSCKNINRKSSKVISLV